MVFATPSMALAKAERAGRLDARNSNARNLIAGAHDSGIVAAQRIKQEAALAPYLARRAKLLDDTTAATKGAAKATETLTKWELKAAAAQEILQESGGAHSHSPRQIRDRVPVSHPSSEGLRNLNPARPTRRHRPRCSVRGTIR